MPGAGVDATTVPVRDPKSKLPTYAEPKREVKVVRRTIAVRSQVESSPQRVAPATTEDPALAESQSFAAAIERWHKHRDSEGALAALDAHERRFPSGSLIVEARVLRAEILLSLGREPESLRLLDRVRLEGSPRARELLTVRGELRVKAGRCAEARTDLDAVLREGASDGLAKRATQALGHCR
jgi:Flp pilus assembly protein TadD